MSAAFPLGSLESWNPGPVVGRVCGFPGGAAQGPPQADEASNVQILQGKLPNLEFLAGSNSELLPQLVAGCHPLLLVTLGDLWLQVVAAGAKMSPSLEVTPVPFTHFWLQPPKFKAGLV